MQGVSQDLHSQVPECVLRSGDEAGRLFLEGWREKEQLQLACLPNQSELVPRECLLELWRNGKESLKGESLGGEELGTPLELRWGMGCSKCSGAELGRIMEERAGSIEGRGEYVQLIYLLRWL